MRRELTTTGLLALVLVAATPSYDRVFDDPAWRVPALAAAAIALLLAALVRRIGRGWLLSGAATVIAAVAVMPWLVGLSDGPVLPGRDALAALSELWSTGLVQLTGTPAPAPPTAGLVLLTAGGWWVVAHMAHELAVRMAREGAALVVMTVLWAWPLAIEAPGERSLLQLVPFVVAAGIVLLASADDESRRTGSVPRLSLVGVSVGAVAVVVAVSAPWLLPGYGEPAWVSLGERAGPRGYQPIVDVSNRLGSPEERDVLRVRSPHRTYLRLAGLDSFDGSTWRLGPPDGGSYSPDPASLHPATDLLPPEEPATSTRTFEVDIDVLELDNIYVPLPYQPVEVMGPLRDDMVWSTEGGFLATWDTVEDNGTPTVGISEGTNYRVRAARPTPDFDQLQEVSFDEATVAQHTQLPRDYPRLGEVAEQVYDAAGAQTVVERALALQDWFIGPEGGFTYDLDVPALRGDDALTDFVLENRVGYCEYFATAMAVMLRETGIPARVAVGFLPGRVTDEPDEDDELTEYTVSTGDAHAWVEVLFPGHGWITFEPTPRSDETHLLPREDDLAPIRNEAERAEQDGVSGSEGPAPGDLEALVPDTDQAEDPADTPGEDEAAAAPADGESSGWGWLVVAVALVLGLVALRLFGRRVIERDSSPRDRLLHAQDELLRTARRAGIGRQPHETTHEVLQRWHRDGRIESRHAAAAPVMQAAAFDGPLDEATADEATAVVAEAEQVLRSSVPRRQRLLRPLRTARTAMRTGRDRLAEWWQSTR